MAVVTSGYTGEEARNGKGQNIVARHVNPYGFPQIRRLTNGLKCFADS